MFIKKHTAILAILGLLYAITMAPGLVHADATSTADATPAVPALTDDVPPSFDVPTTTATPEPTVRVLIGTTAASITVTTSIAYDIRVASTTVATLNQGQTATISYAKGVYTIKIPSFTTTSPDVIRLVPADPAATFTVTSLRRPVTGRKTNYNTYRGTLEYRYSPSSAQKYIINELPLEEYVAGIDESTDSAPIEYLKALETAARTYAYALIAPVSKKHLFDVHATTADQLYLGYNSEITMPHTVAAATATSGDMVTFNGKPVITYYFGHSNGRTKTAGGNRPWLASVPAPYDKGMTEWGHGIGMSCHDAEMHAKIDGWDYQHILGYYYTATAVEKLY